MSATVINMIPVILLGMMVAITLIFLPHLNDETPRRLDETQPNDTKQHEPHP